MGERDSTPYLPKRNAVIRRSHGLAAVIPAASGSRRPNHTSVKNDHISGV